ncbi:MAG: PEP-utilizing enzyme [Candidatus Micrarchaeota archaeon]
MDEWFKWEREATPHTTFWFFEGIMRNMRIHFGMTYPASYEIYRGRILLWCNRLGGLKKVGHRLIDHFLSMRSVAEIEHKMEMETERLTRAINEVEDAQLKSLSDSQLTALYHRFQHEFTDWGGASAATSEPIAYAGEEIVESILEKQGIAGKEKQRIRSLVTSTTRISFTLRQRRELLEIAANYGIRRGNFKRKVKETRISSAIQKHAERYFWMHNGYLATYFLDSEFFRKELLQLLIEKSPEVHLKELDERRREFLKMKRRAIKELRLTSRESKIIGLIDFFGYQQDYRKEFILQAVGTLNSLLKEIGRRSNIPLLEMKYSIPSEIDAIVRGKLERKTLRSRMGNCLLAWREGAKECEVFVGGRAISEERKLGLESEVSESLLEIRGISANPGKAQGVAFVTMTSTEANRELKEGEILVTSMTSPDFVQAMKRCAAIVTNEGGITSHAAVISREFGIPCVVATKLATKLIKTGDFVEVDGNHGFVRISKRMN